MIQRIQSVYLILTTLVSVLFLTGGIIGFSDGINHLELGLRGIYSTSGETSGLVERIIPLTILLLLIPVLSIIAIFLFRNRKLQMRVTIILTILIIIMMLAVAYTGYYISRTYNAEFIPGFRTVLPVIMLILAILAYRGIKKDDELVKSYDRLR